eukprot:CAMPEP_0202471776 /NCGR_PEP_ID=MMETSP1360-20130828/85717_1 /ASSEMBLY_ACC=CAM_ASM_000848 /TAXON_ID=515479 /ORGANISM="Licmophora paradoxa, Strain CCMP2313" /LENGTH=114 /DNA_ID=CAMNT_0049097991 /DNA_START=88 /DNA_END=432 /DNA_ORIENTATION=+
MVLGKQGVRLEAWKFGVYLFIPIVASIAFNDPDRQRFWADYFQFLKYPANPNTDLKEQFEELQKQKQLQKEQRKAYAEQMRKLQESAQKSRRRQNGEGEEQQQQESGKKRGWLW